MPQKLLPLLLVLLVSACAGGTSSTLVGKSTDAEALPPHTMHGDPGHFWY